MTIDEAIAHAQETADTRTDLCDECREEHRQLAQWLIELKQLREENDTLKTEIMAVKSGSDVLKICKLEEENKELKRLLRLGTGGLTMKCENCYHRKVCIDSANFRNADNCRQYKDKSLIVELPCNVSDIVYEVDGEIYELKIKKVIVSK